MRYFAVYLYRNYNSNRDLVWLCVLEKKKPVITQPVKFLIEGC